MLATLRPVVGFTAGTGLVVPLYMGPGTSWDAVAQTKRQYPTVPIIGIVNQNSGNLAAGTGPGSPQAKDNGFASGIASLNAAGVTVLAYVHCSFGALSSSVIQSNMSLYHQWYPGLSGYFFDEAVGSPNLSPSFFAGLNSYTKSTLGYRYTMANPGTALSNESFPASSYIGVMDSWCIFEGASNPSVSDLSTRTAGLGNKKNFAWISFSVSTYDASIVSASKSYVGWLYTTGGVYTTPPTYLQQMAATLAA